MMVGGSGPLRIIQDTEIRSGNNGFEEVLRIPEKPPTSLEPHHQIV